MLIAPEDCPHTVTLPGSPPNAAALSRTQRSAASWSRNPTFVSPIGAKPSAPNRWLIATSTTPERANAAPS